MCVRVSHVFKICYARSHRPGVLPPPVPRIPRRQDSMVRPGKKMPGHMGNQRRLIKTNVWPETQRGGGGIVRFNRMPRYLISPQDPSVSCFSEYNPVDDTTPRRTPHRPTILPPMEGWRGCDVPMPVTPSKGPAQ